MSAWRGVKRAITSAPKRDRSFRGEPITVIISIAQQARPNPWRARRAFARAQFCAFSSVVNSTRSSTYCSRSASSMSPAASAGR